MNDCPVLYVVVPCYNEEDVLYISAVLFLKQLEKMISSCSISDNSCILFVDDGSNDATWNIIKKLSMENSHFKGIRQSRNRGHQNAVWAGLMESKNHCDITISIDCDGQDDITAMDKMVEAYHKGYKIVYGVRSDRKSDSFFKRTTAQMYYKLLNFMGSEVVYNHADYRLLDSVVLNELSNFGEVNLYLRGLIPLVGFPSTTVEYSRSSRIAGKSHYPLKKMISLAINGITSLSIKPLRIITVSGILVAFLSFIGVLWVLYESAMGYTVDGWSSMTCIICFVSGVQLISIGIIGEYVGKIYFETKGRPKYIVMERTYENNNSEIQ